MRPADSECLDPGFLPGFPTPSRLHFSLPLDPARLLRARHRIRDYLHDSGVPPRAIDEIVLAIQEAMTNAVRHSDAGEDLEVTLFFKGRDLNVLVRDHGVGFDVASFDPDQLPDLDSAHGRGLFLISRLMDDLELTNNGGLEVRSAKRDVLPDAKPLPGPPPSPVARAHREARTESVLEEIDEGYCALDWEYRYRHVNGAYERMFGRTREELLGRIITDCFPALPLTPAVTRLREAMELGRPGTLEYLSPAVGRWLELRVYPTASGVTAYIRDIDDRKHKELERDEMFRRSELLARTSARLLSASDPRAIIDELCADVMEHLACDVFFNYLADDEGRELHLNAYAGITPERAQAVECLEFGAAVCGCSAQEVRRVVAEDVQHSDDEPSGLVRALGVQAYAAHPLVARGAVLGTLSFGTRTRAHFTDSELDLMQTIADHVAIAVDRQRHDRALHRAEARAEEIIRTAATSIFEIDFTVPRFRSVNDRMCDATGYTRDELLAMNPTDLLEPDSRELFQERLNDLLAGRQPSEQVEYKVRSRDGQVHDVAMSVSVTASQSAIDGALVVAHDITERTRMERALRESEGRFRGVFENTVAGIALADADGRVLIANQAFLDLLGYTHEEITRLTIDEITCPADRTAQEAVVADMIAGARSSYRLRTRYVRKDGGLVWISLHAGVIRSPDGTPLYGVGVIHDITREMEATDALRQSEEQLRLIFESSSDGISMLDMREHRYVYVNQAQIAMSGFDEDEFRNMSPTEAHARIHPRDRDAFTEELRRMTAGEVLADPVEYRWQVKSGEYRWLSDRRRLLRDADGKPIAVVAISRDITNQKRVEAALRESEERFRALFESMTEGVVLYEIVHEGDDAVDYRILQVNPAFESQSGVRAADAVGKLGSEVHGGTPLYLDEFVAVAETGIPMHLETFFAPLNRHFQAAVVSPRPGQFATIFEDIGERKRAEAELRALYESQRDISLTLQRSFLHKLPQLAGLQVGLVEAPSSTPELVGGDLWDLVDLGDGRVLALIGDVAGSGIEAAGLTWTVRAAVQALMQVATDPACILERINTLLLDRQDEASLVTALVLILHMESGALTFASAGHPAPVCVTHETCRILEPTYGTPLGAFPCKYVTSRAVLPPNGSLVLYTDGVTEARRDLCLFGEARLLEELRALSRLGAQGIAEGVRRAAEAFSGCLSDDLEVMVLQRRQAEESASGQESAWHPDSAGGTSGRESVVRRSRG